MITLIQVLFVSAIVTAIAVCFLAVVTIIGMVTKRPTCTGNCNQGRNCNCKGIK